VKIRNGASKTTSEIDDKNRIEEQFIFSQVFHRTPGGRIQETTAGERFEPQNLESFGPVTQEVYRLLSTMIPTRTYNKSHLNQIIFEETNSTVNKPAKCSLIHWWR
jgi:hypothetical protein